MKMWISKYALTNGIREEEGELSRDGKFFRIGWNGSIWIGTEAHRTKKEAVERAEQMRLKKIASLKKQIAKLEKLRFYEDGTNE